MSPEGEPYWHVIRNKNRKESIKRGPIDLLTSELDSIRSVEEISTEIATVSWISMYAPRRPELEATQK